MNVSIHIERLILDGLFFEQRQGPLLQAAVERELTRLLADGNTVAQLSTDGSVASINGGAIHVVPGADAPGLGKQIATAVYGGLADRQ